MKSPKFSIILESRSNQDGSKLIYLNMSYGYTEYDPNKKRKKYKPLKLSTQLRIHPKYWNKDKPTKQYISSKGNTLSNKINNLKSICEKELDLYFAEYSTIPNPDILKNIIEVKLDRKKPVTIDHKITSFIDTYVRNNSDLPVTSKAKKGPDYISKFITIKNHLQDFESHLGTSITFSNFDKVKFFEWLDFINEQYKLNPENKHGYMVNTISKKAIMLKSLLGIARREKHLVELDLDDKSLNLGNVKAQDSNVYLSEEVLQIIIESDTVRSNAFINARNYLILCSFTSLRYDDMSHLHEVKVEKHNDFNYFITKLRKNSKIDKNVEVCIPIFKPVNDILILNGGVFPKFPANQTLNEQLKRFAEYIGLNEEFKTEQWFYKYESPIKDNNALHQLIKCHIGRSSFITNLSKLNVGESYIETITHPSQSSSTLRRYYDKKSLVDRAQLFVNEVKSKSDSSLYKFE